MRRNASIISLQVYLLVLFVLVIPHLVHAQGVPKPADISFNDWFWHSMDWHSFGSAALSGLMGGALRTMATLRSMQPTMRVFLETLGDALTALVSGFVVFLLLLVWQNYSGSSVNHNVTFVLALIAGFIRGGFITWFDDAIKKVLAVFTDGVIAWLASKASVLAKQATLPPQLKPDEEKHENN